MMSIVDRLLRTYYTKKFSKNIPDNTEYDKLLESLKVRIDKALDDYNTLLNGIDTMVWYSVTPDTYGAVNDAFLNFYGVTRDIIVDKKIWDILSPEAAKKCIDINTKIFETGETIVSDEWISRSDGSRRLLRITKRPKKNGKVHYILGSAEDITDEHNYGSFYKAILQSQSDCIARATLDRRIIYANQAYSNFFCGTDDILACEQVVDFLDDIPEDDRPIILASLENIQKPPYQLETIHRVIRHDGEVRLFHWQVSGILDIDEKVHQIQCVGRDITIQRASELELAKQQSLVKTILDNLPVGIAINTMSDDAKLDYINDNFYKFYRVDKGKISNVLDFWELVYRDPKYREEIKKRVLEDCASGDSSRMVWEDIPIVRPDGTTYISARNVPVPNTSLVLSTVWDITARKQMEEELRESRDRYKELVENISDTIYTLDLNGNITYVSPSGSDIFKYTTEELLGSNFIDYIYSEDKKDRLAGFKEILSGTPKVTEFRCVTKEKEIIWIRNNIRPTYNKEGKIISIYGIFHNITDRKHMEEALVQDNTSLKAIFDNATSSVFISKNGVCVNQNQTARDVFGYSDDEAIGRLGSDWVSPKYRALVTQNMFDNVTEPYYVEALRKDGTTFPAEIQGRAFMLGNTKVRMTVLRDVTDRKKMDCDPPNDMTSGRSMA